jgi:hypothetical protein
MWDFLWIKLHWETIFSLVLQFGLPFIQRLFRAHHYRLGLVLEAKGWSTCQVDSVSPHPKKLKKKVCKEANNV